MSEKTLPPTPSRLKQAAEEGNLGVSQDAVRIVKLLVMAEFAFAIEPYWRRMLAEMVDVALRSISQQGSVPLTGMKETTLPVLLSVLLLVVTPMLLAFMATLAQTKFNIAPKALSKGVDKLNPGNNMKQLVSPQKLLMPLLGPIKGGLLLWVIYLEIRDRLPLVGQAYRVTPMQGWMLTMELLHSLMRQCVVVLLILLITDILLQRYLVWRQLRMDISEVKRDYKQNEGDPMLKGTRKQVSKEMVMGDGPAMSGKQKPSAVVVNPEHIAVALLYEPDGMDMPIMLAAESDEEAMALRRFAREQGVPVIKYVPLARHLLASGKPGEAVPDHTIRAVALLFKVIEEYERLAPDLLHPELGSLADDMDMELAEVDEELGEAMFETPT
ncbi:type III secretion protein U [Roseateles sp. YR242]|uniref:EscU/YscU/HrcU family type III secretion system export apparatus switch protein n=1 Tax=Roseateles sp. YR242 TaxID=1855305 RepID=UPI0008D29B27|nr:EscU/YscU/HrcU family type III secretion system export apparatus switch protein [Roseateles sp. YR242]SEK51468.1 type III secretion protein U [Roseateles sp. YR242]